jgi:hypothetical protein
MSTNPTTAASSQFTAPYDILPNPIFTNPTTAASSQFTAPYDILPNIINLNLSIPANVTIFPENVRAASSINIIRSDSNLNTNVSLASTAAKLLGVAANIVGSQTGIPQVAQIGQSFIGRFANNSLSSTYVTLPMERLLRPIPGLKYADFRSVIPIQGSVNSKSLTDSESYKNSGLFEKPSQLVAAATSRRIDGTASGLRGSWKSVAYAAAAISPVGAYTIFNLDGAGSSGFGWGDHDNPYANRKDFTAMSHVATRWKKSKADSTGKLLPGGYVANINALAQITAFRGDKVNVIDFGKRKLAGAYLWKPRSGNKLEKLADNLSNKLNITQDFIKFFLTGPALYNGNIDAEDDIIVFRAAITALSDSYTANWTPINMIGRADPNYHYSGFSRDVSLSFDIYATDRDEVKPIYRKLNALAGYTAPTYNPKSIVMEAPWMRLTIGDLYHQQPVVLTSLSYTFAFDAPWEINLENDPDMMQVPLKIGVQCSFNMVSDYLPRKGGRFYTLAKQFNENSTPLEGNDNWLSDTDSAPFVPEVNIGGTPGTKADPKKENDDAVARLSPRKPQPAVPNFNPIPS